jgi:hypothetical protein
LVLPTGGIVAVHTPMAAAQRLFDAVDASEASAGLPSGWLDASALDASAPPVDPASSTETMAPAQSHAPYAEPEAVQTRAPAPPSPQMQAATDPGVHVVDVSPLPEQCARLTAKKNDTDHERTFDARTIGQSSTRGDARPARLPCKDRAISSRPDYSQSRIPPGMVVQARPHGQLAVPHGIGLQVQEPPEHSGVLPEQARPQPPQFASLFEVFTHTPPQSMSTPAHLHVPPEQICPVAQAAQPDPQCVASLSVSYAQGVVPPHALKPALHVTPQAPWAHVAVPPVAGTGHTVQLAPQWVGSSSVSKHVPPQFVRGAAQPQVLDWQVIPLEQGVSQLPQWLSSEARSEHDPEHRAVPAWQPLAHAYVVPDGAQTGVPPSGSQAVVQAPQ